MPIYRRSMIAGAAALPLFSIGRAQAAESACNLAAGIPAAAPRPEMMAAALVAPVENL